MKILLCSIKGDAKLEFQSLHNYENIITSYENTCRALCDLYEVKKSTVLEMVKFMELKQETRTLREFVTCIRVQCMKCLPEIKIEEREKLMLTAFCKGLNNTKLAHIVEMVNPDTLEKAYNLIKSEEVSAKQFENEMNNVAYLRKMDQQERNEVDELRKKVESLDKRLKYFENKIERQQTSAPNWTREKKKCFICGKSENHLAKNCPLKLKPKFCSFCRMNNHREEDCFKKYPEKRLRKLDRVSVDQNSVVSEASEGTQMETFSSYQEEINQLTLNKDSKNKPRFKKDKKSKEIDHIVNYVNGNGNKPRKLKAKTLISETRSEPARNKPIVQGQIDGYNTKIFFDSGAESNILDNNLFAKLKQKNPEIKMLKKRTSLKCANGSKMYSYGITFLTVCLNGYEQRLKFLVVDEIFPRVIIGLTGMKISRVKLCPENDGVQINNTLIPFISKIENFEDSENLTALDN